MKLEIALLTWEQSPIPVIKTTKIYRNFSVSETIVSETEISANHILSLSPIEIDHFASGGEVCTQCGGSESGNGLVSYCKIKK